jgi:hypothetical protein
MTVVKDKVRLQTDEVMAFREYVVEGSTPPRKIAVRLGFPRQRSTDGRYECVTEIDDGESVNVKPINGVDSFEALLAAIMVLGAELGSIQENSQGKLTWLNNTKRDLAFPTYPDYSLHVI